MVGDQPFGRGQHPLIGEHEACPRLLALTHRSDDGIADEAQEGVHCTVSDGGDRCVGRTGEREQFGERESRLEQREPCAYRLDIGSGVARGPIAVDVVGEEQAGTDDGLEQGSADTELLPQASEVVGCIDVVRAPVGRTGTDRSDQRCVSSTGVVRRGSGMRLHAAQGRPWALASLPPMSDTPHDGPPASLPAAGRDGKDAALVQAMFDRVAPRYDLANTVLSLGQDGHWRRVTAAAALPPDARAGAAVLDVAAGPGNVAVELVRQGAAQVTALDLSFNMLWEGARKGHAGVTWVNGDALALPFGDAAFDAVTISFGLRNVPDPEAALAEFARVTRPGGRVVVCEFADPTWRPFREVYRRYLVGALPKVARVVSSSAPAYQYLADSILAWPGRSVLAGWMEAAGYEQVRVRDLSGGIVAVHRGVRC